MLTTGITHYGTEEFGGKVAYVIDWNTVYVKQLEMQGNATLTIRFTDVIHAIANDARMLNWRLFHWCEFQKHEGEDGQKPRCVHIRFTLKAPLIGGSVTITDFGQPDSNISREVIEAFESIS